MRYHVSNGEISVKDLKISNVATSSTIFVGDTKSISLSTIFETPPEELIVGVTTGPATALPSVPLVSPR